MFKTRRHTWKFQKTLWNCTKSAEEGLLGGPMGSHGVSQESPRRSSGSPDGLFSALGTRHSPLTISFLPSPTPHPNRRPQMLNPLERHGIKFGRLLFLLSPLPPQWEPGWVHSLIDLGNENFETKNIETINFETQNLGIRMETWTKIRMETYGNRIWDFCNVMMIICFILSRIMSKSCTWRVAHS